MIISFYYRPDNNRIKEVGAHRACAEWLLRCGAHVKWEGFNTFQDDYNKLPVGGFNKFKIEEINADDAAIMAIGFPHFGETINSLLSICIKSQPFPISSNLELNHECNANATRF